MLQVLRSLADFFVLRHILKADKRKPVDQFGIINQFVRVESADSPLIAESQASVKHGNDTKLVFSEVFGLTDSFYIVPCPSPADNVQVIRCRDDPSNDQWAAAKYGEIAFWQVQAFDKVEQGLQKLSIGSSSDYEKPQLAIPL